MKESYTKNIRQGDFFCLEGYTGVEDKIHILMSGRMSVKCDGVFLHNINPNEFVDSIEWKAKEFDDDRPRGNSGTPRGSTVIDASREPSFKVIGRLLKNNQRKFQVENMTNLDINEYRNYIINRVIYNKQWCQNITGHNRRNYTMSAVGNQSQGC